MKKLIMALAAALMISAVFAESKKVKSLSFTFASEKFTVKEEFGGSLQVVGRKMSPDSRKGRRKTRRIA